MQLKGLKDARIQHATKQMHPQESSLGQAYNTRHVKPSFKRLK